MKNKDHSSIRNDCAWCTAAFKPCIDQEGPCTAGKFKSSRLVCSLCPANTFSGAGASRCTNCPAGHYSEPGAGACNPCPTGKFSEPRGSCQTCPADTFNDEMAASECKSCGEGYTSPEGSTSADSCQPVNGAHCWALYDNARLTGIYGDSVSYDEANAACFEDENCTGVTCRQRKGKEDECFLGAGADHEEGRGKWYTYLKEC